MSLLHTIQTQVLATKFCDEPCPMRQAYTESEITRLFTEQAQAELAFTMLAIFGQEF
jgi:hypothetical protein